MWVQKIFLRLTVNFRVNPQLNFVPGCFIRVKYQHKFLNYHYNELIHLTQSKIDAIFFQFYKTNAN